MNFYAWWIAFRPNTLIVSIAPVILGIALSIHNTNFTSISVAFFTLLAAILIQIGTNLVNDLFDYINGADNEDRLGPTRAAQSGLFLQQSLHNLQNEFPTLVSNARGKGLYCAFDLPSSEDRDKLANLLLDEGSILLGSGNYSIRFRPHLNVTEDDINFGMDCFRRALNKLL